MQEELFRQALGLTQPWDVERVALDVARSRIDLYVVWRASSAPCPACGAAEQKIHDHRGRSWRHLDFFQFEAYVHCELPRIACSACQGTTQLGVPWAREGSRFTLMFEALALTLAREMPVSACARILRCSDNALWRQIDAHVDLARAKESYADTHVIGIDETSCAKGHSYITLVHDLSKGQLIYATPGKDASTVQRFTEDFKTHQGKLEAIKVVCMDMSKAFIAGAAKYLPAAAVAFDGFHVVQLANKAVDAVRREEARDEGWLKKTRWCWLKDQAQWTAKERDKMDWMPHSRLKTARAWRIKEALRDIYANSRSDAAQSAQSLKKWLHLAQRSQLHPIKELAKTIKQHWAGILTAFEAAHLHTGYVEAVNSLLQAAKAKARGYGSTRHFIAMAFLIAGKLSHLPANPLRKARA
ncbi:ISL3 family transposase ISIde1 [Comamonadaceae bacterium OS-1]|nr:ISL3 family transposase ISIde1 [Comamonadaceae bacterium OS-1]